MLNKLGFLMQTSSVCLKVQKVVLKIFVLKLFMTKFKKSIHHLVYTIPSILALLELSGCLNSDHFRLLQLGSQIVFHVYLQWVPTTLVLVKNEMAPWVEEQDSSIQC
jgi:hypothetical protein